MQPAHQLVFRIISLVPSLPSKLYTLLNTEKMKKLVGECKNRTFSEVKRAKTGIENLTSDGPTYQMPSLTSPDD
jgi:hypothetical protein